MIQINDLVMVRVPQRNTEEYLKYCKCDSRLALERLAVIVGTPTTFNSRYLVKILDKGGKNLEIPMKYIHPMKSEKQEGEEK